MTVRVPLLHFLLLGAVLFAVKQWLPADAALQTIHVSTAELERLRADWVRDTARVPTEAQLRASLQRHVDEEILLREALQLGLDRADPVARERLIANMRFAFPESRQTDAQLLDEARALGLNARDIVVRRRLAQVMEMRIVGQAEVTEEQLREYVANHPARYAGPARYTFRHVFFNADRSPRDAEQRALKALASRRATGGDPESGDAFLLGAEFPSQSPAEIDRAFGAGFGQALARLETGAWRGPLRSVYGFHLVRVERVAAALPAPFSEISRRAAYALLAERERAVMREALARLRERYRVELPELASGPVTVGLAQ